MLAPRALALALSQRVLQLALEPAQAIARAKVQALPQKTASAKAQALQLVLEPVQMMAWENLEHCLR